MARWIVYAEPRVGSGTTDRYVVDNKAAADRLVKRLTNAATTARAVKGRDS
jgi:hypothetical protein